MSRFPGFLILFLLTVEMTLAGDIGWDERLAGVFCGRLKQIESELITLAPQLENLPEIPIDDQGGTGGFASNHPQASPELDSRYTIEVRWPKIATVDEVALVPSRRYNARGLNAQYGMPENFTVELIDAKGEVLRRIGREENAGSHPVRKGHPFVYQVSPPLAAAGLRISADLLHPDDEGEGSFVHAWAEVFAFEGERNIARGSEVRSLSGSTPSAPWHWSPEFLVDGQTPLGFPEIPEEEHRSIGWLSEEKASAKESAALTVDLGESNVVDTIRLLPAKKPTSDLPSGFGFPRKLKISISETDESATPANWPLTKEHEMRNPGHNPVELTFPAVRGRYVRIEAAEMWKDFQNYPAFFALSEVEVLSGNQNLARGKVVRSSDGMMNIIAPGGRYWSGAALSDGFGPDGRLIPTREWMTLLDRRLQLETRRHQLRAESEVLVADWLRTGQITILIVGLAGAFLIIALPIRYRIHAQRELTQVRERIAGDLHDEVGSNLGSIQMIADLAEGRVGPSSELKRIQRIAAETVSAVRDIVWLLRPEGDHRIGTVEHLRETSSIMLETVKWKFTANEPAWQTELPEDATRHLFLFFREALHNIIRHAKATTVEIRTEVTDREFKLTIADNGVGIDPERMARPATLRALRQRTEALGAELGVETRPSEGVRLKLSVPLPRKSRKPTANR